MIEVELYRRKIELLVLKNEIEARKKTWKQPVRSLTVVLARYASTVEPANLGAVQR